MDSIKSTESIRDALLRLYDPPALAGTPLALTLVERGVLKSARGLYDVLLATIDRMKPPGDAPAQSHGWRCYRYVQLRYVDCVSHESIAHDLGISVRQATRIHQDALQAIADLLDLDAPRSGARATSAAQPLTTRSVPAERGGRMPPQGALPTDLTLVGRQVPEGMVDVAEVTLGVVDTCRRLAATQGIELQCRFSAPALPVRMNRVALRQILLNGLQCLVRVAHRQLPDRGARILVEGELNAQEVTVMLRWEDPPGEMSEGSSVLAVEETALLDVARQIAGLQGASVDELSFRNGSPELRLRLPSGIVRTVLLVDDNPEMGELIRRMLQKSSYHLIHARTAGRALSLVQETRPDVIILDVVMPTRDGWEILAALQTDVATTNVPVMICSVLPDRELALSLGAAGFLAKPVTRPALICALDNVLDSEPSLRLASLPLS